MAYRFTLGSIQVECDSVEELLMATGKRQMTSSQSEAGERPGRPAGRPPMSPVARASRRSWRLAAAYAAKYEISVPDARSRIAGDEKVREEAKKLLAKA